MKLAEFSFATSLLEIILLEWPIIDIGRGYGAFSEVMNVNGYQNIYSIDLDLRNFTDNKMKYSLINFIEENFLNQDVLAKLPKNSWGTVFAIDVFHFMIEEEINTTIDIISNHLRPGGILLVSYYVKSYLTDNDKFTGIGRIKLMENFFDRGYTKLRLDYLENAARPEVVLRK